MPAQAAIAASQQVGPYHPGSDNLFSLHPFINKPHAHHWLNYIYHEKSNIHANERLSILMNLRDVYREYQTKLDHNDCQQMAEMCKYLCDWKLLIDVVRQGLALEPDSVQLRCSLIQACWCLGDHQLAIVLSRRYALEVPANKFFYDYYKKISAWQRFSEKKILTSSGLLHGKRIYLQPLGHQHINDFAWQYADPGIADLCCLPEFNNDMQWHDWLADDMNDAARTTCAVMHSEYGFIGCVGLIRYKQLGFFYYWLGKDFQGYGLGPEAAELLLLYHTNHFNMQSCFAKVYKYNHPSLGAIKKLGFTLLPVRAAEPYEKEYFFYRGVEENIHIVRRDLELLMKFLAVDICFR